MVNARDVQRCCNSHEDDIVPLAAVRLQSAHKHSCGAGCRVMWDIPLHDVSFTLIPQRLRARFRRQAAAYPYQTTQKDKTKAVTAHLRHSSSTPAPFIT